MDIKEITETKHTNEELYYKQVAMLKAFLERHAVSQEQYDKSFHDLTEKMRMKDKEIQTEQSSGG